MLAHEILEREIKGLSESVNRSIDVMIEGFDGLRENVQELREDSVVTREKLSHVATDSDVSQAISLCREVHIKKPINWRGITALVTGIIAAVAAGVVLVIQAL